MKKWIAIVAIGLTMMSMSLTADAARRFGGGMSFGRSAPTLQKAKPAPTAPTLQQKATPNQQKQQQATNQTKPATAPTAAPSPMRGMLMGLAGVLGITALAHALGFGEGFVNFLMMALMAFAAYFVIRMLLSAFLMRRTAGGPAQPQSQQTYREERPEPIRRTQQTQASATPEYAARPMSGSLLDELNRQAASPVKSVTLPRDFDVEGFLSVAEANFVKMQKAWDTGNVTALSDFTTDEVFLAVTQQLRERGNQDWETEVVSLKSEFRGIVEDGEDYLAGVTFMGTLNVSGEAEDVHETWILAKPKNGNRGWLLSGIHQES